MLVILCSGCNHSIGFYFFKLIQVFYNVTDTVSSIRNPLHEGIVYNVSTQLSLLLKVQVKQNFIVQFANSFSVELVENFPCYLLGLPSASWFKGFSPFPTYSLSLPCLASQRALCGWLRKNTQEPRWSRTKAMVKGMTVNGA